MFSTLVQFTKFQDTLRIYSIVAPFNVRGESPTPEHESKKP